jgi:hypothetical protein
MPSCRSWSARIYKYFKTLPHKNCGSSSNVPSDQQFTSHCYLYRAFVLRICVKMSNNMHPKLHNPEVPTQSVHIPTCCGDGHQYHHGINLVNWNTLECIQIQTVLTAVLQFMRLISWWWRCPHRKTSQYDLCENFRIIKCREHIVGSL